jgi:hypothetical protein
MIWTFSHLPRVLGTRSSSRGFYLFRTSNYSFCELSGISVPYLSQPKNLSLGRNESPLNGMNFGAGKETFPNLLNSNRFGFGAKLNEMNTNDSKIKVDCP